MVSPREHGTRSMPGQRFDGSDWDCCYRPRPPNNARFSIFSRSLLLCAGSSGLRSESCHGKLIPLWSSWQAAGASITVKELLRQGLPRQLAGSDCLTFAWKSCCRCCCSCRGAGRIQRKESTTMRRRNRGSSGAKCGSGQPPKLVCALAASLVASMCGLRCMVGSFIVPCPRHGLLSSTPPPPRLPSSHRRRAGRNVAAVVLNRERVGRGSDAEKDGDDG
ncbi:unnamed protein product, partial [Ectocarpus sp. 6 AP-2014]